jgi:hypothetical protein
LKVDNGQLSWQLSVAVEVEVEVASLGVSDARMLGQEETG